MCSSAGSVAASVRNRDRLAAAEDNMTDPRQGARTEDASLARINAYEKHAGAAPSYSSTASKLALPPAAAVLIVTTCSLVKRRR